MNIKYYRKICDILRSFNVDQVVNLERLRMILAFLEPKSSVGMGVMITLEKKKGTASKSIMFPRKDVCLYLYAHTSGLYSVILQVSHDS